MIGDFILIPSPSSDLLNTDLLADTIAEVVICSTPLEALETLILVCPSWYSSSVKLNSARCFTSSSINFLFIYISFRANTYQSIMSFMHILS